jgi:hypothetical protein
MQSQTTLETSSSSPVSAAPKADKVAARKRERLFYSGMAAAIFAIVFAGFAPTYYLRPYFTPTALPALLHVHGVVFSAWLVLFVAQTFLVAANRVRLHRRLGMAGAWLAAVMVVVGAVTAVIRAKEGAAPPGVDALAFLTVPLGDILVFPTIVAAGIYYRRRPDVHKRLMLVAMIGILGAAFARLPIVGGMGPIAFFGLTDLLLVVVALHDFATLGRVHRATLLGGLLVAVSHPVRLLIGATPVWMAFARWLTGLAG